MLSEHGCPIAPSTYYAAAKRPPCDRVVRDAELLAEIRRVHGDNYGVYGARKVWHQLHREGIGGPLHRGTADERRRAGRCGPRRHHPHHESGPAAARPEDLVERQFSAQRPDQLWVVDFTYVATWAGFVYVAFCIDVFSRMITGWRAGQIDEHRPGAGRSGDGDLAAAAAGRSIQGLVHHSDAGSQGGFKQSSQHLDQEVLEWDVRQAGSQRRREGRRCGRPGEHRWRIVSIGCGFGNRSPVGRPVRMLGSEPACHRRLERDGSVRLAGCLHRVSSRTAAAI